MTSSQKGKRHRDGIRAKKYLGQHFLTDTNIAWKIANTLSLSGYSEVLEIGPGTGILTDKLLERTSHLTVMDIDKEAIEYLEGKYKDHQNGPVIILGDFLQINLKTIYGDKQFAVIGNFPYNISTQIMFKALEHKTSIPEFAGMFQKEVAQRICSSPGSKAYGILSVLVQTFFDAKYLFTVPPDVFNPPPKVESGVLKLVRKDHVELPFEEARLFSVVKTAFNQRRKTLRNSLKSLGLSDILKEDTIFDRRPEQLSVAEFITLTSQIVDDTI